MTRGNQYDLLEVLCMLVMLFCVALKLHALLGSVICWVSAAGLRSTSLCRPAHYTCRTRAMLGRQIGAQGWRASRARRRRPQLLERPLMASRALPGRLHAVIART